MDYGEGTYFLGSDERDQRRFQEEAYEFGAASADAMSGMKEFELTEATFELLFREFMGDHDVDDEDLAREFFHEPFLEGWRAGGGNEPA